jgi:hypothetical protein
MKKILLTIIVASLFGCSKEPSEKITESKASASSTPKESPVKALSTYDGPLGLSSEVTLDELTRRFGFTETKLGSHIYKGIPPKPIDDFDYYIAVVSKNHGLCKVIAKREYKNVNGHGDQVKAAVDFYRDLLIEKYGAVSDTYDFITNDTIKRNPEFWMMGLKEETVFYSFFWTNKKGRQTPLPNKLSSVSVAPNGLSTSSALVEISYEFENFSECTKEFKKESANQL